MMPPTAVILLRLLHVVIGVLWVGFAVFIAAFLLPAVRGAGPAAGGVIAQLQQRRLSTWLMIAAIVTILSGFGLYAHDSAALTKAWLGSGPGRTFGLGAVFGVLAMLLGMTVNSPTASKLRKLGEAVKASGGAPSADQAAEMQRLQERLGKAAVGAAVLLVLAASSMAVARYIP